MVHGIARRYLRRMSRWYEYGDLVSIGLEALWRATLGYDPDNPQKAQFQTYARRCVIFAYRAELHYWDADMRRDALRSVSLEDASDHGPRSDWHLPHSGLSPEAALGAARSNQLVQDAVAGLSWNERWLIEQRVFGEKTLKECGKLKGVSGERIRQIEAQALQKLRKKLDRHFRADFPAASPAPTGIGDLRAVAQKVAR